MAPGGDAAAPVCFQLARAEAALQSPWHKPCLTHTGETPPWAPHGHEPCVGGEGLLWTCSGRAESSWDEQLLVHLVLSRRMCCCFTPGFSRGRLRHCGKGRDSGAHHTHRVTTRQSPGLRRLTVGWER